MSFVSKNIGPVLGHWIHANRIDQKDDQVIEGPVKASLSIHLQSARQILPIALTGTSFCSSRLR